MSFSAACEARDFPALKRHPSAPLRAGFEAMPFQSKGMKQLLASYVRNTPECFHELRVEQGRSGAGGVKEHDLGSLIVEAEGKLQAVGRDLRGGEAELEDRPRTGHGRRGVLLRG